MLRLRDATRPRGNDSQRLRFLAGQAHERGQDHQRRDERRRGADHEQQAQAPHAPMVRDEHLSRQALNKRLSRRREVEGAVDLNGGSDAPAPSPSALARLLVVRMGQRHRGLRCEHAEGHRLDQVEPHDLVRVVLIGDRIKRG